LIVLMAQRLKSSDFVFTSILGCFFPVVLKSVDSPVFIFFPSAITLILGLPQRRNLRGLDLDF